MAVTRHPGRTKEAILEAAENLIVEKGFQAFTLDEIAERASVSKGGLLHHYPNKQSLVLGLAEHMIVLHEQEINTNLSKDPEAPGAFARAYLRANLECVDECTQVCAMLAAESRNNPPMLKLFQDYSAQCQHRLENDGLDPVVATTVRYAAEGLRSAAKCGLPRPANYDQIFAHLLNLAGAGRQRPSQRKYEESLQSL